MKFVFMFTGLLCGLFSIGGLIWPDPDGSLKKKNQHGFDELVARAKESSATGLIFKVALPFVSIFYLPFFRPAIGLVLAITLIAIAIYL